ncbi:CHASE2 domain-containing protein [Trinickia dinghuensis]|uniref:histidine kinase n=1 Tax=Trinickia dinghuensis TaxID=2291023 RepID=A0A3D8JW16_9BURK|nr:CHASE2 domain-containing protein [Trinickia dinghuensis]RDU96895.1 CHASE2 domain-containing protein [Trinickia dinghuensis]
MTSDESLAPPHRAGPTWRPALSVWQRFMWEWLAIGCFGVAAVFFVVFWGIATNFNRLVYDRMLTMRSQPLAPEISVVRIDDDSVSELGRWPWPRTLQARLIDAVAKAGAAAIVYDVLLTEPSEGDDALAQALRSAPTYLPLFVDPRARGAVVRPVPELAAAAAGMGHIDVEPDSDGIVRGVALQERADGSNWPYLVMPLLDDIRSGKIALADGRYRARPMSAGPAAGASTGSAIDEAPSRVLIPFSGSVPNGAQVSARDLLDGNLPSGALAGKIVFVGLTASGLLTHLATPITGTWGPTSDTLLHANALSALLRGREIRPVRQRWLFVVSLAPLAALLAGLLFLSPWRTLLLTIGLGIFSLVLSAVLLDSACIWLSPVPALIALAVVYPLWSWRRLEMTMSRLQGELQRLADDPDDMPIIPVRPRNVRGDALERHIALVEQAADRMQDMKRFVWDCLNSLPEPILVADRQGLICVANKAARECFAPLSARPLEGRLLTEMLGEMTFIKTIAPEPVSDAELIARWPEVLDPTDLDRVWIVKRGIEVRDHAERDYLLRYARCRNARGEASGYWVVGLADVTALHAAEQAREDALRLLSHDMRSPHASVLALIEDEMAISRSERVRTLLEHIERYTRRALTLADDFVQLTRAESQAYVFEPVNLADVVLDASDEIWPQARAKGIFVETHFEGDGHWIHADRSLMTRAVTNLLNNAVKYSPAETIVHVSVTNGTNDRIHCRIADQGYGMTEDAQAHLFERFRRFRTPGQPHSQGAGLGMALVKTVVTRHEGEVTVASEPGRGTTVTVSVPRWDGEA